MKHPTSYDVSVDVEELVEQVDKILASPIGPEASKRTMNPYVGQAQQMAKLWDLFDTLLLELPVHLDVQERSHGADRLGALSEELTILEQTLST